MTYANKLAIFTVTTGRTSPRLQRRDHDGIPIRIGHRLPFSLAPTMMDIVREHLNCFNRAKHSFALIDFETVVAY